MGDFTRILCRRRRHRLTMVLARTILIACLCLPQPRTWAQAPADGAELDRSDPSSARADRTAENLSGPAEDESSTTLDPQSVDHYVGEMYQIGLGWHPAALDGLPTDKFGLVDWVAALEDGMITPRGSIEEDVPEAVPFDMNIVMPSKTGMIAGAYFPHKAHTMWLGCESCHVKIFLPMAGSNDLTMSTIVEGKACGVCHGKVAFPLNDCTRCHVPETGVAADSSDQP